MRVSIQIVAVDADDAAHSGLPSKPTNQDFRDLPDVRQDPDTAY